MFTYHTKQHIPVIFACIKDTKIFFHFHRSFSDGRKALVDFFLTQFAEIADKTRKNINDIKISVEPSSKVVQSGKGQEGSSFIESEEVVKL